MKYFPIAVDSYNRLRYLVEQSSFLQTFPEVEEYTPSNLFRFLENGQFITSKFGQISNLYSLSIKKQSQVHIKIQSG